jgi:hypothetical protein
MKWGWEGLELDSKVKSSCAIYWLCDFKQVTSHLCACVSSVSGDGNTYPLQLL